MKLLHVAESYPPHQTGVAEQVYRISAGLSALGHEVAVATGEGPEGQPGADPPAPGSIPVARYRIAGNAAAGMSGQVAAYQEHLRADASQLVTVFCAQQWSADAAFPVLEQIRARKVFVPVGLSGLHHPAWAAYYRELPAHLRCFDAHILLSSTYQDAEFLRQHRIGPVFTIPNGAASEEFGRDPVAGWRARRGVGRRHLIVLIGNHTGWKGHVESMRLLAASGVRDATLLIIGRASAEAPSLRGLARNLVRHRAWCPHGPGCGVLCQERAAAFNRSRLAVARGLEVRLAELPRSEVVAALFAADLMLFPSNVECSPIVLFEAAAAGLPFLATDVGNVPEIAAWTGAGEVLPTRRLWRGLRRVDVAAGAAQLARRLADRDWLSACRQRGRSAWRSHFTWEAIAARYAAVYQAVIEGRAAELAGDWQVVPGASHG
jgi:glycosyltransferase involved in cell wall biosynthesis